MKTIFRLYIDDIRHLTSNVVSIIIAIGLIVIPGLFTWFNVGACWDPFANTGNLKFAIANDDKGYQSDLLPVKVTVGDQIINTLRANSQLDWEFTTSEQAIDGTKSGKYYAAVVIPAEFSKDLMTFFTSDAQHATLDYYDNEKLNPLAPHVMEQGADTISAEINQTFAKTIASSALSIASGLVDNLDTPQAKERLTNFNTNVSDLASTLNDTASAMHTYSGLTTSAKTLFDSSTKLVTNADKSVQATVDQLKSTKSTVDNLTGALGTSADAVGNAITASSTGIGTLNSQATTLFDNVDKTGNDSATALKNLSADVTSQANGFQQMRDSLAQLESQVPENERAAFDDALGRFDSVIALHKTIATNLTSAADDLTNKVGVSQQKRSEISSLISQAKDQISGLDTDFANTIKPQLSSMNASFTDAANQLDSGITQLKNALGDVSGTVSDADNGLDTANTVLNSVADELTSTAQSLTDFQKKLSDALASGDVTQIKNILGKDAGTLATTLAAPVSLKTIAVFPVKNFGTALSPFYTFIPLWTGALLLVITINTSVSKKRRDLLGDPKQYQLFLGHYLIYATLAILQVTFSMAGLLLFLRIQCIHPLLFLAVGWLSAIVYSLFTYTMVVSFANVGKAIGVIMLVLQISGSNGAYPIAVVPKLVQDLNPWLPLSYSITAVRSAIAGIYDNDYWIAMGKLALFIPPLLLLGLVLRRPLRGFNRWYSAKVESTKLVG